MEELLAWRAMQLYIGSAQQCPFAVTGRVCADECPTRASWESVLSVAGVPVHLLAKERRRHLDATLPLSWALSGKVLSYLLIGWVDGGAFRHC